MFKRLQHKIEKIFFAGLLVTIPTMISFFLLKFLVNYIDNVSAPLVTRFFNTNIPGIGFFVTILIVLGIGFLGTNIIGKTLVLTGERLVSRIPLVRSIYTSAKQILETVAFATEKPFKKVVVVPYPRPGLYAIGFVTREAAREIMICQPAYTSAREEAKRGEMMINVFLPTTPNPTSGLLLMFPRKEIIPLAMDIEDGLKYLMTGGIVVPKQREPNEEEAEEKLEEWDLFLY